MLLTSSDEVAFSRINSASRNNEEISIQGVKQRNRLMKERFIDNYGVDFTKKDNFNMVIETDNKSIEEITILIIQGLSEKFT